MQDTVLSIQGLRIEARAPILQDISLQVRRGEIFGVIGESGAGKSTLAMAMVGLLRAGCRRVAGKVTLVGQSLFDLPQPQLEQVRRRKVSYVAQSAAAAFNPFYRLGDQVTELAALEQGTPWPRAARWRRTCSASCSFPTPKPSECAIRLRFPAGSCSGR